MGQEQFVLMMSNISAELVAKIAENNFCIKNAPYHK